MRTQENNEYHKNGQLAYTETIVILEAAESIKFENARIHPSGYQWIRTGRQAKYFDNGQLAWELQYDKSGKVIKDGSYAHRKDGSNIIH